MGIGFYDYSHTQNSLCKKKKHRTEKCELADECGGKKKRKSELLTRFVHFLSQAEFVPQSSCDDEVKGV